MVTFHLKSVDLHQGLSTWIMKQHSKLRLRRSWWSAGGQPSQTTHHPEGTHDQTLHSAWALKVLLTGAARGTSLPHQDFDPLVQDLTESSPLTPLPQQTLPVLGGVFDTLHPKQASCRI